MGVEKARQLAQQRGVSGRYHSSVADLDSWDWDARQYDIIAAIFIQFAGPDTREAVFAGMKKALKPGGLLLSQGYLPKQLQYGTGGPKQIDQLYTRAMLEEAFGGFRDVVDTLGEESAIEERCALIGLDRQTAARAEPLQLLGRETTVAPVHLAMLETVGGPLNATEALQATTDPVEAFLARPSRFLPAAAAVGRQRPVRQYNR